MFAKALISLAGPAMKDDPVSKKANFVATKLTLSGAEVVIDSKATVQSDLSFVSHEICITEERRTCAQRIAGVPNKVD